MSEQRFRMADAGDIPVLKQIWQLCFDDSAEYIDFFFANRFPSCRAVIAELDGTAVGAAYLLPAQMRDGARLRAALYGYAFGVHPAYRRRGICEAMLQFVYAVAEKEDAVFFLKPATPALAKYYEQRGVTPTHFSVWRELAVADLQRIGEIRWTNASGADWSAAQHVSLGGTVRWDENALTYARNENIFSGGFCISATFASGRALAVGNVIDGALRLNELYVSPLERPLAAASLVRRFGVSKIYLRESAEKGAEGAFLLGMSRFMKNPHSGPLGPLLD